MLLFLLETNNKKRKKYLITGADLQNYNCLDWLGRALAFGKSGFKKDARKGRHFLELAAKQGYPAAYSNLGRLMNTELNSSRLYGNRSGLAYFQKASDLGHRQGTEAAGRCCMELKEYEHALKYLMKAKGMVIGDTINGSLRLERDIETCLRKLSS